MSEELRTICHHGPVRYVQVPHEGLGAVDGVQIVYPATVTEAKVEMQGDRGVLTVRMDTYQPDFPLALELHLSKLALDAIEKVLGERGE